jgi:hypothetical protein
MTRGRRMNGCDDNINKFRTLLERCLVKEETNYKNLEKLRQTWYLTILL